MKTLKEFTLTNTSDYSSLPILIGAPKYTMFASEQIESLLSSERIKC